MVKKPVNQMTPRLQFLIFVAIFAIIFIICNLLGIGIVVAAYSLNLVVDIANLNFTNPQSISALYILQIACMTVPIFAAPVYFSYVIAKQPDTYLKPTFRFPWMLIVIAFFIMLISSPLIELSSNFNQKMVFPEFLKGLEQWMKEKEEGAKIMTEALLRMNNVWDCIKNVVLVGLLTAIAEEFMFRGVLQTILTRWTKNTHAAIWITAILFSAFHMEFYGFLPRMFLGALFGYFVAWSGSIWPAVWGHFLNNGSAVLVTYLFQQKKINLNPDDQHVFNYAGYIFSFIIIIVLLLVYKNIASGLKPSPEINGEELG